MYYKKINKASRKEMVDFLENHFRYSTANSWNNRTSYANNVKIWRLHLSPELEDKFWEMQNSDDDEFFSITYGLMYDFREKYGYDVAFNGRSAGYLVLYNAEKVLDEYKSYCTHCGQKNYSLATEENKKCGKCGRDTRVNYKEPRYKWVTNSNNIDQYEDFNNKYDWPLYRLKKRVELVQAFDKLCDDIRDTLIEYLKTHEFVDEEYTEVKTRKIAKEIKL